VVAAADVVVVHARPADVVRELLEGLLQDYQETSNALQRCWTRAAGAPGYIKADWQAIDAALSARFRDAAEALGHRGPLVVASQTNGAKIEDA
jgi:hypothetical protein